MDEDRREQIALFRYGVISELVSRPLAAGEKEKLLSSLAAKTWAIPGSERTHIGRASRGPSRSRCRSCCCLCAPSVLAPRSTV